SRKNPLHLTGRTENNRAVNFAGHPRLTGQFVDVLIAEALPNSLRGRAVESSVEKIIQNYRESQPFFARNHFIAR
ncbi:MAG: TRAM domain-containing protein, partial [Methylomonas sp.]